MGRSPRVRIDEFERRLTALERTVAAMATEVRTGRLTVTDGDGRPRIVATVDHGTAELRLESPGDGHRTADPGVAAVLFATPGGAESAGMGPAVGLQLWAGGDAVAELDAWPDESQCWRAGVHVERGNLDG